LAASIGSSGAPSNSDISRLDAADTSGLSFQAVDVGAYGSYTPVPTGAPSGTQVVNIPPHDGENGFFKVTFTLPSSFSGISLSGSANIDDKGRVFLNGNPISPSILSGGSNMITEYGNATFSTTNASFFNSGTNEILFADANTGGGPSGAAFYVCIAYGGASCSSGSGSGGSGGSGGGSSGSPIFGNELCGPVRVFPGGIGWQL
jgi:hypothetical protein